MWIFPGLQLELALGSLEDLEVQPDEKAARDIPRHHLVTSAGVDLLLPLSARRLKGQRQAPKTHSRGGEPAPRSRGAVDI